jgi:hypothetical protein
VAERTLSERELNRALLARQLLLDRANLPIPRAVERIGGLQTQYAPSAYVGLWSRLAGFRRDDLTRALERRAVVQGTMMRVTIHIVSKADYWPLAEAIRLGRREWWVRAHGGRVDPRAIERAAARVRQALSDGPRPGKEVTGDLGLDATTWNGVGLWLDLVRVPPSGTWERRRADVYATAEGWIGPSKATAERGIELLVRRYLSGFGPAAVRDIASWAGLAVGAVGEAVDRLPLRRFRDERGDLLVDLPRAPLPPADAPAPVRFLPTWDATLLVHARRTQILPEAYRPLVFNTKTPHSVSTFLVDGRVAGTWRDERGRVRLEPFDPLPRAVKRELEEEARALSAFVA